MIIYQVDLKIKKQVSIRYLAWLKPHMEKMMTFQGFLKSELCKEIDLDDQGVDHFTVIYHVSSQEDLNFYFEHHAKVMRDEGVKRFGDACHASRKVYSVSLSFG
ncbi:DUF4286 family protein [uncultured Shewanella sp.]|uniref:DUF4286 family protein n=1 Tax=uncultured Shewanella sp. TaxID=173975 RepID=UPI00260844C0|nr:DUF4286 family protein [uncultured Shewanella sp.]